MSDLWVGKHVTVRFFTEEKHNPVLTAQGVVASVDHWGLTLAPGLNEYGAEFVQRLYPWTSVHFVGLDRVQTDEKAPLRPTGSAPR